MSILPVIICDEMKNKYIDLIEQTFEFPQDEFTVEDNELYFHEVPLMDIIKQYGTPLKISYLPKISQQINRAKRMFNVAMAKVDYKGSYNYCYCTKSSHFSFVLEEALKNEINLETSSAYDIHIINALYESGLINKDIYIVCNGFKRPQYVENIDEGQSAAFFAEAKLTRQKSRDEAVETMKSLIESDSITSEQRTELALKTSAMATAIEQEGKIENLIKAKGFEECMVYYDTERVDVMVKTEGLEPQQVAQMKDIIIKEVDIQPENISIIEVK